MNQKQYNEMLAELAAVFKKYSFNPSDIKVRGQAAVEERIQEVRNKPYQLYRPDTYGSTAVYEEFKRTSDLKLVWAHMSASVKLYELDPIEVAKISPDVCPVTGALIDYGYGLNRTTDNPYFRPGIDHIRASGNGGAKFGDITNIQIVSEYFNTIKNYGTGIDAIKWAAFELRQKS